GLSYEDEWDFARIGAEIEAKSPDGRIIAREDLPSSRTLRGESIAGEDVILRTPRGLFHVCAYSEQLPAAFGQPRSALLGLVDITSLKEQEAELQRRESELRFTLESARMGSWTIDLTDGQR